MNYTLRWLKAAAIRCLRTAGQTIVAVAGSTALLTDMNWYVVALTTGMAVVLSFATSLASLPEAKLPDAPYDTEPK